jgi:holo-[acyl-carrier protein] synthase
VIVGSGVDVIEVARIERSLDRAGERFLRRVFTPAEIELCRRARRPASHLAVRFAAKEAVMKAVGTGWARGVRWVDIETVPESRELSERLALRLHGRVGEIATRRGSERLHLAVSRTRTHALALVLLEGAGS